MSRLSPKVEVMFRVSVLSTCPSTGTSWHTRTLKRGGEVFPPHTSLCISSTAPTSSLSLSHTHTHTHTHTQAHPHKFTLERDKKGERRRWEEIQNMQREDALLSLSHTHAQLKEIFFYVLWQPSWWLGTHSLSKLARLPHLRISSQKFITWHKTVRCTLMRLQNDDAVCLFMCGWVRGTHTQLHIRSYTHPWSKTHSQVKHYTHTFKHLHVCLKEHK